MASNFEFSIQRSCDFIYDFACSPCEEDGLNTEARHFCNQCTKHYCDNCVPVHNKLYKRHAVLDRKDVKKWVEAPGTVYGLERCTIHPSNSLELVCVDHDQLCCHECVVDHSQCSSIQHIQVVAKGIRKDPIFTQLQQKVAYFRKQLEYMEDAKKQNCASLQKTRAAIIDEIRTVRKNMNGILDRMEKTTVQELDDLIAKQEMSINKDIDFCKQLHEDLNSLTNAIENNKTSGEPTLYIGSKKLQDKLKEAREHVHRMSSVKTYGVTYQPDKAKRKGCPLYKVLEL